MTNYIMGVDAGTSSVKAGLLNLSNYKLEYCIKEFYDNAPTQDPELIWKKTVDAIIKSAANLNKNDHIKAIGLSGQMHGTVLYDSEGNLLGPLINWQDGRCNKPLKKYNGRTTVEVIEEILGSNNMADLGINKMASGFLGPTLFYLKENDKKLFNKIRHAVFPLDFIRGKLLEKNDYNTDQTNAFGSGLFNTRLNKWHNEFITKLGLPLDVLPEVHYTTEIAGYLPEKISAATCLEKGIPVIYGGGDSQVGILGSGAASDNFPVLINIGTAAQISQVTTRFKKIDGIDTRSFFNGFYCMVGATLGGGKSYEWLRDKINQNEHKLNYSEMDYLALKVNPGSDGLNFKTGPSRENIKRKKGFYGKLGYNSSIGHKSRAVMEGVLIDLFKFYRLFNVCEHNDFIIGAGDGILKSKVWAQIASDLFSKKIKFSNYENCVFGSTLLAAYAVGLIKNFDEVFNLVDYSEILPDESNSAWYKALLTN
jgi:xylulokinase